MTVLTGEYEAVRREARKFAEKEVAPIAHELYNEGHEIPMEIIQKMANLGYFAMAIPEEYEGLGMDTLTITLVTEELSRVWLSVGSVMTRMLIAGGLLLNGGTEEQKQRWLPGIASGDCATGRRLHRAQRRLRHGRHATARGQAGRQLHPQRPQDLDHLRQPGQPDDRAGPHRPRRQQAPQGPVDDRWWRRRPATTSCRRT